MASHLRVALLIATLALVVVVHAAPHWDVVAGRRQDLPIHMDEYVHWGYAKAALDQGSVSFGNPFTGAQKEPYSPVSHLHERGFQAYLGALKDLTGLPWTTMMLLVPLAVSLFLALAAYALAEPWGAGVEAALWTAAIPTTLRFLGPGFAVPIMFALPLVLIGATLAFHHRRLAGVLGASLVLAALWTIHAMGALALGLILCVYGLMRLPQRPWHGASLLLAVTIPLVIGLPYALTFSAANPLHDAAELSASTDDLRLLGAPLLALAALGTFHLASRKEAHERAAGTTLGLVLILLVGVLIARIFTNMDAFRLYDRSVSIVAALGAILAGAGTTAVARVLARPLPARAAASLALGVTLIAGGLVVHEARDQFGQDYYVVLTPHERASFEAATDALGDVPGLALVEGLRPMAFTDITGRPTLFVRYPGDAGDSNESVAFFADGARDTYLLVSTGTTIVVTQRPVENPALRPVADGVYVLDPDLVKRMFG